MTEILDKIKQWSNDYHKLADHGRVDDLIPDEARFLFLLESPHVHELKHGAPVSGTSGASMTKHLYEDTYGKEPLGLVVKKGLDPNRSIALMNVCTLPMQGKAYPSPEAEQAHHALIHILEGIRTKNDRDHYPHPDWNAVQDLLVENLRSRLRQLTDREMTLVPCGRFAQKFFRLADVHSPKWRIIEDIPHPSYNNWGKPAYAEQVDTLKREFHRVRERY